MQSPISSLRNWNGENALGNWFLGLGDFGDQDIGTLHSWSITVCGFVFSLLDVNSNELQGFEVYPNPNKGAFTVKLNNGLSKKVEVMVSDLLGRAIYKEAFNSPDGNFNEHITLNNMPSGIYILNVTDGLKKSTKKIIVE